MNEIVQKLNWQKTNDLIPVIIQDEKTQTVLMLGYMNQAALLQTITTKLVTFYSRSRQMLWIKGKTSGNYLKLCEIKLDCDSDALLITVNPLGPTCHQGNFSCFNPTKINKNNVISYLEEIISMRQKERPQNSYITSLFNNGLQRIAQKIGEEGVEVALAALVSDDNHLTEEIADLFFHILVLLGARTISFSEVLEVLIARAI